MVLQNFLPLICHQWASCVVFFLSDDGPESSFLGTKKPHNKLILCGLVLFRLLLAGICPARQVEVEGFEPSSKRGPNKLSTCLVIELVFVLQQAHDDQLQPYPLNFSGSQRLAAANFRISLHLHIQTSRNRAMGRCLVHVTLTRIKQSYYTSDQAARA